MYSLTLFPCDLVKVNNIDYISMGLLFYSLINADLEQVLPDGYILLSNSQKFPWYKISFNNVLITFHKTRTDKKLIKILKIVLPIQLFRKTKNKIKMLNIFTTRKEINLAEITLGNMSHNHSKVVIQIGRILEICWRQV